MIGSANEKAEVVTICDRLRRCFRREPDFAATSVKYDLAGLSAASEEHS